LAFLADCLEADAPIALSSDAHVPEHVGFRYDAAIELSRLAWGQRACGL